MSGETRACVLVVRFYQLHQDGTRRKAAVAVDALLDTASSGKTHSIEPEAMRDLSELARAYTVRERTATEVRDCIGLSRAVKQFMAARQMNADDIVSSGEDIEWDRGDDEIRSLLNGEQIHGADFEDVNRLADILRIPPILLANCLVPAASKLVVVRRKSDLIPVESPGKKLSPVRYSVPNRNLACSDVAVTSLSLSPSASSPRNDHPGFELVVPLAGAVDIEMANGESHRVDSERFDIGLFRSNMRHRVRNTGSVEATMYVIRFYVQPELRASESATPVSADSMEADEVGRLGSSLLPTDEIEEIVLPDFAI